MYGVIFVNSEHLVQETFYQVLYSRDWVQPAGSVLGFLDCSVLARNWNWVFQQRPFSFLGLNHWASCWSLQLIMQFRMRDTWHWKVTTSLSLESATRLLYGLLNSGFLDCSFSISLRSYLAIYSKWTKSGRPNYTIQPWLRRGYDAIF